MDGNLFKLEGKRRRDEQTSKKKSFPTKLLRDAHTHTNPDTNCSEFSLKSQSGFAAYAEKNPTEQKKKPTNLCLGKARSRATKERKNHSPQNLTAILFFIIS